MDRSHQHVRSIGVRGSVRDVLPAIDHKIGVVQHCYALLSSRSRRQLTLHKHSASAVEDCRKVSARRRLPECVESGSVEPGAWGPS